MFASEIGQFSNWLKNSPLSNDRLWLQPLERISDNQIQLFYARAGLCGLRNHAREAIDTLQSELLVAAAAGKVPEAAMNLICHEVPQDPFTVDEFVDCLAKLNKDRRQGVLMALTTRSAPERIICMEWPEVRRRGQFSGVASEILSIRAKVRHMRLPYVFWEHVSESVAAPLFKLQKHAEEAFGGSWPSIQQRWGEMLWIDRSADAASFMNVVNEAREGKL